MGSYLLDDEDCVNCCELFTPTCNSCRKFFKTCLGANWGAIHKVLNKDAEISFSSISPDPCLGPSPTLPSPCEILAMGNPFIIPGPFYFRNEPGACVISGALDLGFGCYPILGSGTRVAVSFGLSPTGVRISAGFQTGIFGGSNVIFERLFSDPCEFGCPDLSGVPWLDDIFSNTGCDLESGTASLTFV